MCSKNIIEIYEESQEERKFHIDMLSHREPICPQCGKGKVICPKGKIPKPHYFECSHGCGWYTNIDYMDTIVE